MTQLFKPGQVVATQGAAAVLDKFPSLGSVLISRHLSGDWGNVPPEDARENDFSVKNGYRIISSYLAPDDTKIWIITEADRSATTFLLPEEY